MKEGGDWSSERRRPHGSTRFYGRSIIPDWASLPPELLEGIADRVLSTTGGVDAYMDMRAVCSTWRSAVAKPPPLASIVDIRFRPRHWVMLDLKSKNHNDDGRLFLHVPTGRLRRLRLRVLRGHHVLGASDGLIVLSHKEHPGARVLNPFTGDMLHFAELFCDEFGAADVFRTAVSGGPNSTLVVWRDREWRWNTVMYADPTSEEFTEVETGMFMITTMVTFQGNIYLAGLDERVLQFVRPAEKCDHELVVIAQISPDVDIHLEGNHEPSSYLVESAGELLLVRHHDQALKVFRVDVEHKLLEEVKSLGGCRALFLGDERCVSVDANMLPSVHADCIYLSDWVETGVWRGHYMHVFNLRDDTMEILFSEPMLRSNIHPRPVVHVEQTLQGDPLYIHTRANIPPEQRSPEDYGFFESRGIFTRANNHCIPPLSLIQVLLDYCNDNTCF